MQFFKRLEIHGFKSFANKTVIDFHPGVTVIVGPNGCGKSNVFDSIRWVLGEQSAKSMRGSRMGDVIFNGSGGQKAMGMARVTLTLNNQDRHLPMEFDEVEIARRLFRTGESEYIMNKNQCRLRDITMSLMDTGIGTDSYSVLEQGKVDAIINSKPLERRVIFDEAAGISKYKARKDEALNKLKRTEEDRVRLTDLISEVRRQSNSLKRQAAKAERYRELSHELKSLEMQLLVKRYFMFRVNSASDDLIFAELSEKTTTLRNEIKALDESQISYRSQAYEVQQNLDDTQALKFELNQDMQDARSRIALLDQQEANSAQQKESLRNQIAESTKALEELLASRTLRETEKAELEIDLAALKDEHQQRETRYRELKNDSDGSAQQLSALRQSLSQTSRSRMEADNEQRVALAMLEKLAGEIESNATELEMLREQCDALTTDAQDKKAAAEVAASEWERLKQENTSTRDQLRAVEAELYQTSADAESARRAVQECHTRHEALSALQANYDGYYQGVKAVMTAGDRKQLKGLVGVVTTLIEARPEHELAIEIALGAQAQDVVVESAEDGKAAIKFLKDSRVGRATFLPLDLIEARETPHQLKNLTGKPGVIGLAAELVRYDERLKRIVQYLLGNTVIVKDIDTAIRLQREGIRTRFVTLEGEMVSGSGAMTGGSIKAAGLLNRTREINDLAKRLGGLRKTETELSEKVAKDKLEVARLREVFENLGRETQAREIEAARTRKDCEVVEHRAQEKQTQLGRVSGRQNSMEQEIANQQQRKDSAAARFAALAEESNNLEAQLVEMESHTTDKQSTLSQYGQELHDCTIRLRTTEERLRSVTSNLEQTERESARARDGIELRTTQLAGLDESASGRVQEREDLAAALEKLVEQQKEMEAQIFHENEKREIVQLDLRKLGERGQVLQRDYNEASNELHEVELRRTEQKVQLHNLRMQSEEKFSYSLEQSVLSIVDPERLAAILEALALEPTIDEIAAVEAVIEVQEQENPQVDSLEGDQSDSTEETVESVSGPTILAIDVDLAEYDPRASEFLAAMSATEDVAREIGALRASIDHLGPVHVGAIDEFREANERLEFLTNQETDLEQAHGLLTETIAKIDLTTEELFTQAFTEIRANFEMVFRRLFGGGRADLLLTNENGMLDSGIDIVAQPPGKKPQHISLLSGGEKALTAVALLFAIFLRKPSPFCILDEIDAPLDDKNIERFKDLVQEFAHTTQFIIITHNKQTMHLAHTIYGVTMEEQGVSRVVSIKLDDMGKPKVQKDSPNQSELELTEAETLEPVGVG